jgi:hypothetical protein
MQSREYHFGSSWRKRISRHQVGMSNISRAISLAVPIMFSPLSGGIAARGQSVKGTPDGGAFRMGISKCHKLLIAAAEVAAQLLMVMVAVVPAPVIQYQRREDDPRHFPADSLLKPVVRIAQGQALHVRRHISAAFRQPVKLPESP